VEKDKKPAARASARKATAHSKVRRPHSKPVNPAISAAAADLSAVPDAAPRTNVMPTVDSEPAKSAREAHDSSVNRRGWWVIGGTVVALLALFLIVFGVLIYSYQNDSRIVQIVSDVIPYPAERINGHFVSYSDYLFEVNSVKHYYLSQTTSNGTPAVNFTTATGKKQLKQLQSEVLTELQQNSIITQLASKYKVSVSNQDVQNQVNQITKSAGGEDKLKQVLQKYYGWSVSDLDKKVRFQLLQQKVTTAAQSDPAIDAEAKAEAQSVLNQVKAGGDFATLAKKYSQDSSAANGGDLGFFSKSQMVPAFSNAAFALQPGQVSGLVKTQYGYSIIKVIEYNSDHSQVHAAQILIKPIDFTTYLQQQLQKAKINQYIHP
jgi:foldase protein PrsA